MTAIMTAIGIPTYLKHGTHESYRNMEGLLHREDGPAQSWGTYRKEWYFRGERHNFNGPAVLFGDGIRKEYFIYGKMLIEDDFLKERKRMYIELWKK